MRRAAKVNGEYGAAAPLRKRRRGHLSPAVQQVRTCSNRASQCRAEEVPRALRASAPPPHRHRRITGASQLGREVGGKCETPRGPAPTPKKER